MLHEFLLENERQILGMTEAKARELAGDGPSSDLLKKGLPVFYLQLMTVLRLEQSLHPQYIVDKAGMAKAARDSNEPAMSAASGRSDEVELARAAGRHGVELLRLGYTLSHVVHAYGAMCQSITELAIQKDSLITPTEFHDLNQCLDVAIAGAVTEFESHRYRKESNREIQHLGFLAHELRNALNTVVMAFGMVKEGAVTATGSTGQVLERGLKRLDELIDRSLTEVRLKVEPKILIEPCHLLQLVDQILVTAKIEAHLRKQSLEIRIDPALVVEVDQQLFHSALSNLIQNALKYTHIGGKIQIRAGLVGANIEVEVEDECGGLSLGAETDLFKPFEQQNGNREGLGLGLTIAQRAILLNHGLISVQNLPKKGCIFKITLPTRASTKHKEGVIL
jgi:signal transduction histidine kinase